MGNWGVGVLEQRKRGRMEGWKNGGRMGRCSASVHRHVGSGYGRMEGWDADAGCRMRDPGPEVRNPRSVEEEPADQHLFWKRLAASRLCKMDERLVHFTQRVAHQSKTEIKFRYKTPRPPRACPVGESDRGSRTSRTLFFPRPLALSYRGGGGKREGNARLS